MENVLELWKKMRSGHKDSPAHTTKHMEKMANIFSAGPFYYYVLNHPDQKIDYVHPNIENVLGIASECFSLKKYLESIHPEDLNLLSLKEKVATEFLLQEIPLEQIHYYKISYLNRVKTVMGQYKVILHQAVPLTVTDERKMGHMLIVHTDISYLPASFDHKISIISLNGARSWYHIDPEKSEFSKEDYSTLLSKRERQVLSMISEGKKSMEIANHLNISAATVSTHRKNILSKTTCKNTTELIGKCIKSGLI